MIDADNVAELAKSKALCVSLENEIVVLKNNLKVSSKPCWSQNTVLLYVLFTTGFETIRGTVTKQCTNDMEGARSNNQRFKKRTGITSS